MEASSEGSATEEYTESAEEKAAEAVVGDHGMQPKSSLEHNSADQVHASSAPPPSTQSGVPIPEDQDAGVQPGEPGVASGMVRTAEQVAADEAEG